MSKLGLKHHLQNDHVDSRSKEVRSKKFDGRKKVYICTLCDFQTIFRKSLDKHQQIHLPPGERQQFPCAHCDKKYTSKTNVQHHLQNNHIDSRAKELNKLQKKVYRCSTCSYQARDMSGLRQHNLVHLAPEERQMFACAHCEKKYTLKRNLRRHLTDDHTDTRMKESQKNVHRCSTCSYQTRDISTLRQHEKLHLAPEERQMFVCTQCDKKFSRKYDLKRHLKRRIHSR
ncbi:GDNF-inducible zinc finger protein 1-like [Sitophilus oryzae]|uniref:GDNF-inducible zinc finger protein 1-like n=1 Tax=Sitophilus oryzae TaxID=7048 RepID=A0A6J2YGY1_SITOR|nr:GDNF-inducible zinc finger protein 1-like [Sitophilus oryzae]